MTRGHELTPTKRQRGRRGRRSRCHPAGTYQKRVLALALEIYRAYNHHCTSSGVNHKHSQHVRWVGCQVRQNSTGILVHRTEGGEKRARRRILWDEPRCCHIHNRRFVHVPARTRLQFSTSTTRHSAAPGATTKATTSEKKHAIPMAQERKLLPE
jgi:hypothetical protein